MWWCSHEGNLQRLVYLFQHVQYHLERCTGGPDLAIIPHNGLTQVKQSERTDEHQLELVHYFVVFEWRGSQARRTPWCIQVYISCLFVQLVLVCSSWAGNDNWVASCQPNRMLCQGYSVNMFSTTFEKIKPARKIGEKELRNETKN